jgi:hypothetical protein
MSLTKASQLIVFREAQKRVNTLHMQNGRAGVVYCYGPNLKANDPG